MVVPIEPLRDNSLENLELDLLLQGVYQYFGDDFRGFERGPVRERVARLQEDWGLKTVSGLQERALHDPEAGEILCRTLCFSPGNLFGEPERLLALRELLVPWLRSCALPRIWLAECCSAEDVFAVAILLAEEGLYERTQIFVTNPCESLLQELRRGVFPASRLAGYDEGYRRAGGRHALADYCTVREDGLHFAGSLRANITWSQYSLASDMSFNEFQLILCCRPLSEFGLFLRRRALWLFNESLCAFGLLVVDGEDDIEAASRAIHYQPLKREHGIYRRKG